MIPRNPIPRIPSYLPELQSYLNAVATAGGAVTMDTVQALDRFVRDCKISGVWDKLTEVYPLVGSNLTTAMVKLKTSSALFPTMTAVNLVAGDYTERGSSGGIAGDGSTKYIDTNYNIGAIPSTGHLAAYIREAESGTPRYWIGAGDGSNIYAMGQAASNPNIIYGGLAQHAIDIEVATTGFYQGERLTTSSMNIYRNGVLRASNTNATVPVGVNQDIYLLCRNATGVAANFTSKRFGFFSAGLTMSDTERAAYYAAVQNLQTNLGRNV